MKILVVAATQRELEPGLKFYQKGEAGTHSVSFHCSGVGLTAAAIAITRLALQHSPDLIIQAGIAGCFQEQLSIGDVVFIQSDRQADLGVWENDQWKNVHDLSLINSNEFPYTNEQLINPYLPAFDFMQLPQVMAVSVNQITTSQHMINYWTNQRPAPAIESMEGAALHESCLRLNVPFLQLRSVSNYIGERNKAHWNIPLAIDRLNQTLIRLLQQLPHQSLSLPTPQQP